MNGINIKLDPMWLRRRSRHPFPGLLPHSMEAARGRPDRKFRRAHSFSQVPIYSAWIYHEPLNLLIANVT